MPEESENGVDIHIGDKTLRRWSDGIGGWLLKLLVPATWLALGGLGGYHGHHLVQQAQAPAAAPAQGYREFSMPKLKVLEDKVADLNSRMTETERKVEGGNQAIAEMKGEVHTILELVKRQQ